MRHSVKYTNDKTCIHNIKNPIKPSNKYKEV